MSCALRCVEINTNWILDGAPLLYHIIGPIKMIAIQADLEQAFKDYRKGENGFEGAVGWRSVEGNK